MLRKLSQSPVVNKFVKKAAENVEKAAEQVVNVADKAKIYPVNVVYGQSAESAAAESQSAVASFLKRANSALMGMDPNKVKKAIDKTDNAFLATGIVIATAAAAHEAFSNDDSNKAETPSSSPSPMKPF